MDPLNVHQAQQGEEEPATTIGALSDDLLAKCFACLSQKDRLARAALVCRHWREVSARPQLQREVVFNVGMIEPQAVVLPAALSLLRWVQRHGTSVRRFTIEMDGVHDYTDAEEAEILSVLDSCLLLCSGGLEGLTVSLVGRQYTLGGWTLAAPHLREMTFAFMDTFHTWFSLSPGITALQRLDVSTTQWQLSHAVRLPGCLTCLCISNHQAEAMPSQVAALTNLRSLRLSSVWYSAASIASLTRLISLQHAAFIVCNVPDSLSQLRGLQVLEVDCWDEEAASQAAILSRATRRLTQLTGLYLRGVPDAFVEVPCLTALSRLQWLFFELWAPQPLEPGGWQRNLRHLITDLPLAMFSMPFLRGAEQLQRLSFPDPDNSCPGPGDYWDAFWLWAAKHPHLQRMDCEGVSDQSRLIEAIEQLHIQRPALRFDVQEDNQWDVLKHELLGEYCQ